MRVSNFRNDLLQGIAALLSIDPTVDLSPEFAAQWTSYVNTRIKQAWDYYDWPELMATQERAFRPIYRADQDWFTGDEVCYLPNFIANVNSSTGNSVNVYYRAVSEVPQGSTYAPTTTLGANYWIPLNQAATFTDLVCTSGSNVVTSQTALFNAGDKGLQLSVSTGLFAVGTSISSVTNSTTAVLSNNALANSPVGGAPFSIVGRAVGLDKYVAYDQIGQQPIGEVYGAYNFNPRLRPWLTVPGLYFRPSEKGVDIAPFSGNSVYLWYKIPYSQFTSTPWVAGIYFYGQSVYWTDGNCYQCGVHSTTTDPTDNTSWFVIPLPTFIVNFVKTAAAGDAADDARVEATLLKEAEGYLNGEIDKLMGQGHAYCYTLRRRRQVWLPYGLSNFWWSAVVPWQGTFVTTLTDTYYTPIPDPRIPTWVTDSGESVVDDSVTPILVPT